MLFIHLKKSCFHSKKKTSERNEEEFSNRTGQIECYLKIEYLRCIYMLKFIKKYFEDAEEHEKK